MLYCIIVQLIPRPGGGGSFKLVLLHAKAHKVRMLLHSTLQWDVRQAVKLILPYAKHHKSPVLLIATLLDTI